jgi:hypothetical protein
MATRRQPDITPEMLSSTLPQLIPTANNSSGARKVYEERQKYRSTIMPADAIANNKNFWGSDRLYGKVDLDNAPVLPAQDQLKQLRYTDGNTFYALNFVADAWRDLAQALRQLRNQGVLYENSPWAEPVVKRAYLDIPTAYDDYMMSTIYPSFSYDYLEVKNRSSKVLKFSDYLSYFTDYFFRLMSQAGPLSLSSYIEGTRSSPNISGLVIEISDAQHDDDQNKILTFVDANFALVHQLISHYGFSFDINAPWRLVANIDSPAMREYMKGVPLENINYATNQVDECGDVTLAPVPNDDVYGFSQIPGLENTTRHALGYEPYRDLDIFGSGATWYNRMFSASYQTAWRQDMNLITQYIIKFYQTYTTESPVASIAASSSDPACANGVQTLIQPRHLIDPEALLSSGQYGPRWMLKNYFNIRVSERNVEINEQQRRVIIQEILNIYDQYPASPERRMEVATNHLEKYLQQKAPEPLTIYTLADMMEALE